MPSPKEYIDLLRKTVERIPSESLLSINQIGTDNQALTIEDILYRMGNYEERPLMAVNYRAHYPSWRQRLEDFLDIDMPEYVLEYLVTQTDYLEQRKKDILIPLYEELLQQALDKLEEKYGKRKLRRLKKRLPLKEGIPS
ncbi:MAG: hypothetical protein U9Q69_05080 [Nanoarchaeota archaeon]|nr:hypothetical protein [Nanoarchaeota archaeon]